MSNVETLFKDIKVVMARGIHLFPFRTEKLSLVTPMVLRNSGRVGSRRFRRESVRKIDSLFLYAGHAMPLWVGPSFYREGGEEGSVDF